jgi:hypothetical protein
MNIRLVFIWLSTNTADINSIKNYQRILKTLRRGGVRGGYEAKNIWQTIKSTWLPARAGD